MIDALKQDVDDYSANINKQAEISNLLPGSPPNVFTDLELVMAFKSVVTMS